MPFFGPSQTTVLDASDTKPSVRCATTANGTLATAFANGQSAGGVTLATGDRIALIAQSAGAENGIYTVNAAGAPTRASDFDTWGEIPGAVFSVEAGTYAGARFQCTNAAGGTLGTTAITFVQNNTFTSTTYGINATATGASGTAVYASAQGATGVGVFAEATESGGTPLQIANSDGFILSLNFSGTANRSLSIPGATQALSGAGAANLTTETTKITTTGAGNAITLADGVDGQHKYVLHDVDGGSFVLTPTTKTGWTDFTSTAAGESIHLLFVTTRGWIVVGNRGGTIG